MAITFASLRRYFQFRPQFWPTVIAVPAFLVLIGLGVWQVQRLVWKSNLIATMQYRAEAPPFSMLPAAWPADQRTAKGIEYRRAVLSGRFLYPRTLHFGARFYRGKSGYHLVTPFQLTDGRIIFAVRGWVDEDHKQLELREDMLHASRIRIHGILRRPGEKAWFTPENQPEMNLWFWQDLPAMQQWAGLASSQVIPMVLDVTGPESPDGWPVPLSGKVRLRDHHLPYALTWFALAFALLVIYIVYHQPPRHTPGDDA